MAIFPKFISDIEPLIASFCDFKSLINLSGVSKTAYKLLSNDGFFKTLFKGQHPQLDSYDKQFTELCSYHPTNCYKVMCQVMNPTHWEIPLFLAPPSEYLAPVHLGIKWTSAFLNDALPLMISKLKTRQRELEARNKELCGSHYQDPSSLIDIAWRKYEKCKEEYDVLMAEYSQAYEEKDAILSQLSEPLKSVMERILNNDFFVRDRVQSLLTIPAEDFIKMSGEERIGMKIEHLEEYRKIARFFYEFNEMKVCIRNKSQQLYALKDAYDKLERERRTNDSEVAYAEFASNRNPNELLAAHPYILFNERRAAYHLERALRELPHLERVIESIQKLIDHPEEKTDEALNPLRQLINALTFEDKTHIWGLLYYQHANGVVEDAWSENHFQDFLPDLKTILEAAASRYRHIISWSNLSKS